MANTKLDDLINWQVGLHERPSCADYCYEINLLIYMLYLDSGKDEDVRRTIHAAVYTMEGFIQERDVDEIAPASVVAEWEDANSVVRVLNSLMKLHLHEESFDVPVSERVAQFWRDRRGVFGDD